MKSQSVISNKEHSNTGHTVSEMRELCSEFTDLAVSLFDIETRRIVYCSDSFKTMLGYPPKILIDGGWEFWLTLIKPSERPAIRQKLNLSTLRKQYHPAGEPPPIEYHVKSAGGEWTFIRHEVRFRNMGDTNLALNLICNRSEWEIIDRYFGTSRQTKNGDGRYIPAQRVSDREKQVLRMIAYGMPSRQIAKKLYISNHTVISHRKNLIEKFGVKNTAELIYEASKVLPL